MCLGWCFRSSFDAVGSIELGRKKKRKPCLRVHAGITFLDSYI